MEEEISSRPIAVQLKSAQKVWNTLETLWKYPSSETGYGYEWGNIMLYNGMQ